MRKIQHRGSRRVEPLPHVSFFILSFIFYCTNIYLQVFYASTTQTDDAERREQGTTRTDDDDDDYTGSRVSRWTTRGQERTRTREDEDARGRWRETTRTRDEGRWGQQEQGLETDASRAPDTRMFVCFFHFFFTLLTFYTQTTNDGQQTENRRRRVTPQGLETRRATSTGEFVYFQFIF